MRSTTLRQTREYSELNRRLSELMQEKGMTLSLLAKEAGVALGTIQKLMTDPSCNPTIASLEAICHVLKVSISDLISSEERLSTLEGKDLLLLNWEEDILLYLENSKHFFSNHQSKRTMVKASNELSQNAFALKMRGNSMLPLFPEDSTLIFDPQKIYHDHSYVLVKLEDHDQFVFKLLLIDEPSRYIKSINPIFKKSNLIELKENDQIVATLAEARMQY